LQAASNFPDWNPRHFLDTAEMAHAFAIGYDWLYDQLTPDQRATLRTAMIQKGLNPALESYRTRTGYGWWTTCTHNWNQVCNGGISLAALAIAEDEPQIASEILSNSLRLVQDAMAQYAPMAPAAKAPATGTMLPTTTPACSPGWSPPSAPTSACRRSRDSPKPACFPST